MAKTFLVTITHSKEVYAESVGEAIQKTRKEIEEVNVLQEEGCDVCARPLT
jgi:hypothetical protein